MTKPQATDCGQPATTNARDLPYPRIHADLGFTFRLVAPKAHSVSVQLGRDANYGRAAHDMNRDSDGV